MRSIMHCLAGVRGYLKSLAVVIAKFKSLDKKYIIVSGGKKVQCPTHHISFFLILARKVSILGLSTEWGDRIFQSIIVRGKNENL